MMKAVSLLIACVAFAVITKGVQPLEIQTAVEVKFGTSNNRIYQLESASPQSVNVWRPAGPAKWGRGKIVTNIVETQVGSMLIFRSSEYDLTNGLAYYFPFDSEAQPGVQFFNGTYYTESRFGTPNHATLHFPWAYSEVIGATIRHFAPGTNDFAISVWGTSQDSQHVFGRVFGTAATAGVTNSLQLALATTDSGSVEFYFGTLPGPMIVTKPLAWAQGRWYCFQLVRRANMFKIFRDTQLIGEAYSEVSNNQPSFVLLMGPAHGSIDELRLYNRALSDDEFGVLYRLEEH